MSEYESPQCRVVAIKEEEIVRASPESRSMNGSFSSGGSAQTFGDGGSAAPYNDSPGEF